MLCLVWLIAYFIDRTPPVQPWNAWFIGLFIAIIIQVWLGVDYLRRKGWTV